MKIKQLITKAKEEDQDFEFYPSTKEMLRVVSKDMRLETNCFHSNNIDVLDVGCGNGNALELMQEFMDNKFDEYGYAKRENINIKKFGIEKSETLILHMKEDVMIVGCDFEFNTLIDKPMDYVFCNPPYSKYEAWAVKLIKESKCKILYLIIPQRWKDSENIIAAIKRRCDDKEAEVLGSFDFLDSEYRKARAKVDILKINLNPRRKTPEPFDIWFDEHFKIETNDDLDSKFKEEEGLKPAHEDLVNGQNLIERIVELYQHELSSLLGSYKQLQEIPFSLLKELGVNKSGIKEGLQNKIKGLKNKYWQELFDNMDKITSRLTTKFRERILEKLVSTKSIDVNAENMYSVVVWVIKHANVYQDEQLLAVYESMTEPKNVKMYKSNIHFLADTFRSQWDFRKAVTKYKLDYRLVFQCGVSPSGWGYSSRNGLSENGFNFINDIFTIAKTLGMKLNNNDLRTREWKMGKQEVFLDDDGEIFAELRPYMNGNLHAKLSKEFIMKLNIEAGKLNKWIKDPKHAASEMDIPVKDVMKYFTVLTKIDLTNPHRLLEIEAPEYEEKLPEQMELFA